jgi:hypothetical protein
MSEPNNESPDPLFGRGVDKTAFTIDVRYLLLIWLKWSWFMLILAAIGGAIGIQSARNFTPLYEASLVVQPSGGSEGISASQSRISSALGIAVGGSSQASTFGRLEVLIGSVTLAEKLQERHKLLQEIYAGQWSEESREWKRPVGKSFERDQKIRQFFGLPLWSPPNVEDLARYLGGAIKIREAESNGFFEVAVSHPNPEFALKILRLTYFASDDMARNQDLVESKMRREYIQAQLGEASLLDSRQALIGLLTGEERRAMLLSSDLPYAARIIEPPFVSSRAEEPSLRFKILFPSFLWGLAGLVLVTFVALLRRA